MKKILMVGFALGALIAPAVAADMPVKAPPPPPRVSTWTGCYLGGSVGGVWRQSEGTSVTVVDGGSGAAAAAAAGAIPTSYSYGGSSWLGGGQLGCNYQASSWVFGAETDISGTKLSGGETLDTNVPLFFPLTSSVSQETHWIGTTRARLGMTWGNVLLYGTGGAAYANMNYAYAQSNIAGGGPVAIAAGELRDPVRLDRWRRPRGRLRSMVDQGRVSLLRSRPSYARRRVRDLHRLGPDGVFRQLPRQRQHCAARLELSPQLGWSRGMGRARALPDVSCRGGQ